MNNLTRGQVIAIGIAALFGVPICIGIAIGYVLGFWVGVLVTVVAIATVAFIALRWWQRKAEREDKHKKGD